PNSNTPPPEVKTRSPAPNAGNRCSNDPPTWLPYGSKFDPQAQRFPSGDTEMNRIRLERQGAFIAAVLAALCLTAPAVRAADDADLRNRALALNDVTGDEPINGQVRALVADPAGTKKLLAVALPMVKEKDQPFNYNAAYILGRAALQLKEYETSQAFYRACVDQAAKIRSPQKLIQGLTGLMSVIDFLYLEKKYDETAKLCQEFLEILEREGITQEVKEDVLRQWIRALTKQ